MLPHVHGFAEDGIRRTYLGGIPHAHGKTTTLERPRRCHWWLGLGIQHHMDFWLRTESQLGNPCLYPGRGLSIVGSAYGNGSGRALPALANRLTPCKAADLRPIAAWTCPLQRCLDSPVPDNDIPLG